MSEKEVRAKAHVEKRMDALLLLQKLVSVPAVEGVRIVADLLTQPTPGWSKDKPTVEGWYWSRYLDGGREVVRDIRMHDGVLMVLDDGGRWWEIIEDDGEWSSQPLLPPVGAHE